MDAVTEPWTTPHREDVIDMVKGQHLVMKSLFLKVEAAPPDKRDKAFDELRAYIAVHEAAEETVVHPLVRRNDPGAEEIVDALLQEEHDLKQVLAELETLGVEDEDFLVRLAVLKTMALEHADNEERLELPLLVERTTADERADLATSMRATERIAPTHPHAGIESAAANVVMGPVAAVVDRARDTIKAMTDRDK